MNERKLRLYKFLLEMQRIQLIDVPEPYKTAIESEGV